MQSRQTLQSGTGRDTEVSRRTQTPVIMASYAHAYAHEPSQMINCVLSVGGKRFKVLKTLAEGGNGHIFLVINQKGVNYAMKRVIVSRHQDPTVQQAAVREYEVMKTLIDCNNILVPVAHEVKQVGDRYVHLLVMPYCTGSVLDAMNRSRQGLPKQTLLKIVYDTARGLYQMHAAKPKKIAHRDLKVENVLWNREQNCFQLCDFGSASTNAQVWRNKSKAERSAAMDDIERNTTVEYRSPEQCDFDFHNYTVDHRVDLWALGCMIYHLCFYRTPFQDGTKLSVMNGDYKIPENKSEKPKVLIKLIKKLLHKNPGKRPSALAVLKKLVAASKSLTKPEEIPNQVWEHGEEDAPQFEGGGVHVNMGDERSESKTKMEKKKKKKKQRKKMSETSSVNENDVFDAFSENNFFADEATHVQHRSKSANGSNDDLFDTFFDSKPCTNKSAAVNDDFFGLSNGSNGKAATSDETSSDLLDLFSSETSSTHNNGNNLMTSQNNSDFDPFSDTFAFESQEGMEVPGSDAISNNNSW